MPLILGDTSCVFTDRRSHARGQRHAVVISVDMREEDPNLQLFAFGPEGPLWSLSIQVARLCLGPAVGMIYSPSVLLFRINDSTTNARRFKAEFPRERLESMVDFCDDDADLVGYDHINVSSPERLWALRSCLRGLAFNLGKEVPEATCRTAGKEFFAEDGTWTDDMSKAVDHFPSRGF